MRELKTSCNKCIFNTEPGCELSKDVFQGKLSQLTYGFCGHKRTIDWLNDRLLDPQFKTSRSLEYINGEYRTLSVIVVVDNELNHDDFHRTIESCINDCGFVRQIIVSIRNPTHEGDKELVDYLNSNVTKAWTIDAIRKEEYINPFAMANYSARTVKNFWFLPIMVGDTLKPKDLELVYDSLGDPFTNWLAFYFDDDDDFKVITNGVAFNAMEGHYDLPWFRKIREFDNWESVCKKII